MGVKKVGVKQKKLGIKKWGYKNAGKNPSEKKKCKNNKMWTTMTTKYYQLLEVKLLGKNFRLRQQTEHIRRM